MANRSLLPWESGATAGSFGQAVFRPSEREQLAKTLSVEQILNTTVFVEDNELKRKHRWRYIRNFYGVTRHEKYKYADMETALWSHQGTKVTAHHFVAAMMAEYDFEASMYYDQHLSNLYLSFEGGKYDSADWRDILSYLMVMRHFRTLKEAPLDLFMRIFDLYTLGARGNHKKETYVMQNCSEHLKRIFLIPCISDAEVGGVESSLVDLCHLLAAEKHTIQHRAFKSLLQADFAPLLASWAALSWTRIPTELRLIAYDDAQLRAKDNAEAILFRHKIAQAVRFYHKTILRRVYREWKLEMLRESGVRVFLLRVLYRRRHRFFKWWDRLTVNLRNKRRGRYLADVMGNYSLKARAFARIKLFIFTSARLARYVGSFDKSGRAQKMGGFHLREYGRRSKLRKAYHTWWNKCVDVLNLEMAVDHERRAVLRKHLLPWFRWSHEVVVARRAEEVTRENEVRFRRMMDEADETALELVRLEGARVERARAAEEERVRAERAEALRAAVERAGKQRAEDRLLLLAVQKEERERRGRKALKKLKKGFRDEWKGKTGAMLMRAKNRISAYIENKENRMAIDMKFDALKRDFFQPPTPENAAREGILSSLKNITFLYIQAKLRAELIDLHDLLPKFDLGHKGYLTYSEFKALVTSIGADVDPAKMSAMIRGVDKDGDKCIDMKELETSMGETDIMGTKGSVWRWYIDPSESVMTYHNFVTGERIFDYQMRDEKLREIAIENMYGEADHQAIQEVNETKRSEWELLIKNMMARRLQYMYRSRQARKWREKKMWKLTNTLMRKKHVVQMRCVRFLESTWVGWRSREAFKRQLNYSFEKVWDLHSGRLFWFNVVTGGSSWDRPRPLSRYHDVDAPSDWVSNPVVASQGDRAAGRRIYRGADLLAWAHDGVRVQSGEDYVLTYWHMAAKKGIPRKPDGLPLCCTCQRNIGVHFCKGCTADYCLPCHRGTHGNPFGFHQHAKATKDQYSDPDFLQALQWHQHHFVLSRAKKCEMCKAKNKSAAFRCDDCGKDMCRECSRRIHEHKDSYAHTYYNI
mmetsp:Transcript_21860/g.48872  ORF Transcript_21860/g.48872 Transcript_21860/m.48872 type:complete len:1042 (-) Transcript_21860:89-3214(-)